MKWLMILSVYMAPPTSVDWDGPWTYGKSFMSDTVFDSEAECRNEAIQTTARMHQVMLAPMRYVCVPVEAELAKGAPR